MAINIVHHCVEQIHEFLFKMLSIYVSGAIKEPNISIDSIISFLSFAGISCSRCQVRIRRLSLQGAMNKCDFTFDAVTAEYKTHNEVE